MTDHPLIATQLDVLAARLPTQSVDELADGLRQTYADQLTRQGDPDAAANGV